MARTPEGAILGETVSDAIGIYAGGFIIDFDQRGGTMGCCADTFNGYVWGPSDTRWRMLYTTESLPPGDFDLNPDYIDDGVTRGGFGIAVNGNKVVGGFNGYYYFSDDYGASFTRGNLALQRQSTNKGVNRWWGPRIAMSPANTNHVLLGTSGDGTGFSSGDVFWTTDFGATITAVSGIAAPQDYPGAGDPSPHLCAIHSDGTTAYIFSPGTGLYQSTTGVDGTFSLVTDTPEWCSHLLIDADGVVWICDPTDLTDIYRWDGSWTTITVPGMGGSSDNAPHSIAVDPADTAHVVVTNSNGTMAQSLDGGATWIASDYWNATYPAPIGRYLNALDDVPWLEGDPNIFPSKIQFNPDGTNELWCSHGDGVMHSTPPATHTRWDWYSQSIGIQELVGMSVLTIPGNPRVICGYGDQGTWTPLRDNLGSTAVSPKFVNVPQIDNENCYQHAYASDDPDFVVAMQVVSGGSSGVRPGLSTDGMATMGKLFPSGDWPVGSRPAQGGAVAVGTKQQIILVSSNNGPAYGNDSFDPENPLDGWAVLPGLPADSWILALWNRRKLVTADPTREGVFAIVVNGDTQGAPNQGLWVTTTGPLGTWVHKVAGRLDSTGDPFDFWHCTLRYIPGKSGELLYTTGRDFNSRLLHFTEDGDNGPFDVGATWSITKVAHFGFGAPAPGETYPTVFFLGEVSAVFGLYRSTDFFTTEPTLLQFYPNNSLDVVNDISGDVNKFGRWYATFNGSGTAYGDNVDRRDVS